MKVEVKALEVWIDGKLEEVYPHIDFYCEQSVTFSAEYVTELELINWAKGVWGDRWADKASSYLEQY